MSAPIRTWIAGALSSEVSSALQRLAACDDVRHGAVMPDVHLASAVCIGVETRRIIACCRTPWVATSAAAWRRSVSPPRRRDQGRLQPAKLDGFDS